MIYLQSDQSLGSVESKTTLQLTKNQKSHRDVYISITWFKDVHLNKHDKVSLKSKLKIYQIKERKKTQNSIY